MTTTKILPHDYDDQQLIQEFVQNHSNGGYWDIITTPNILTPQMNKVTDNSFSHL